MPLQDHFHPPISNRRQWESFHALWTSQIVRTLNRRILPASHFAEAQVHVGSRVEVDVATLENASAPGVSTNGGGGVAVEAWAPPVTTLVMPAVFPDEIEIQVYSTTGGASLVGAIEFISPGNKDRRETRRAFAAKCASYLQMGIGVLIVDVVTDRHVNLHDDLIELLEQSDEFGFPTETPLYSVAYRPVRRPNQDQIEIWRQPLALGQSLPTMPLALRGGPTIPIDLENSYIEVCLDSRL